MRSLVTSGFWTICFLTSGADFTTVTAAAQEPSLRKSDGSATFSVLATDRPDTPDQQKPTRAVESSDKPEDAKSSPKKPKPKHRPYATVVKDAAKIAGMLTLYRKDDKLYAELVDHQFNRDYIVLITIARGIGQRPLYGGRSWGVGDDWVWQFRKAGEKVHLIRRNVRFKAKAGSPTAQAVKLAYTDSVLFSLPVVTKSPSGALVVDLTSVFMSDLPQIARWLPGFSFSRGKSTWAEVKGYPKNMELQVAATYSSNGTTTIDSVPDSRGATINIHYSISELQRSDYQPRLADDRVGYFLTVVKDFSKQVPDDDRFVRYINRWNLQKIDPQAETSPPKKPIVFYLEKTIPYKYRKPIRDGILEWNQAFEAIGFYDAIEVRQQEETSQDGSAIEPADVRFNFFRWITSGAGLAMGPSRVNPTTGEILDADIIFDADFLQYWKREYETFTPKGIEMFTGGSLSPQRTSPDDEATHVWHSESTCACHLLSGTSHQLALSAAVLAARTRSPGELDKLMTQALKETTMHEVGHTLGLRHNFKASTYHSIAKVNQADEDKVSALSASVMDYTPVNIVPRDREQGNYYSSTIGPYDYWAIEYGYRPLPGGSPDAEIDELRQIAGRSGEPGLTFGTDEDAYLSEPDPNTNKWDFGDDTIEFAKLQAQLVAETWPDIIERMTVDGQGYQQPRRAFGVLLASHGRAMFIAARQVGGLYKSRSHKGDQNERLPFTVVPADKQREALALLEQQIFSDEPFQFPAQFYNQLAATHWNHWGSPLLPRSDFPVHAVILMWQQRVLDHLLAPLTLRRLHDSELKVPAAADAFTTAELIERLTRSIFSEVDSIEAGAYTNRQPAISSLRRNLQRAFLRELTNLTLGHTTAPQDCQTIAYMELVNLRERIDRQLDGEVKLDSYSRAHLRETSATIAKILDARILQQL